MAEITPERMRELRITASLMASPAKTVEVRADELLALLAAASPRAKAGHCPFCYAPCKCACEEREAALVAAPSGEKGAGS
jgi:hypothetical protein